jgi:diketogulonate reductase-like aldo/keto reductase
MVDNCPEACHFCGAMYDPQPPHWVALWNGLLMPTVGLGTAGLGDETEDAVRAALQLGFRSIDTAQAPEWYRENLVGVVCELRLCATLLLFVKNSHVTTG